ncbi:MAG TPA: hypothetical protein VFN01_10055 [Marinobacter sp.]|nr:hypothetical protein [Marinobacter sp.]HET8801515.1 hypothetical protein [Marinobacter sp.]
MDSMAGEFCYGHDPSGGNPDPTILAIRDWVLNVPGGLRPVSPAAAV